LDHLGVVVLWTLIVAYAACAIVTTPIVLVASRPLVDPLRPATNRFSLAVVAGLMWPLLLLGLVELSTVVILSKALVPNRRESGIAILA
jgi:hypothetical protein